MNEYFVNIVKKLGLLTKDYKRTKCSLQENRLREVEIAISKYKNHSSINVITEKREKHGNPTFGFNFTFYEEIVKEVNNLKSKKVSQKTDMPIKVMKENTDIIFYLLYHNFDNSLSCSTFPTGTEYEERTPKKDKKDNKKYDENDKESYRQISILQIYPYLRKIFSKFQCGFLKGFNAQHCLLAMVETLDKGDETGTPLTNLPKAFNCTDHNLLFG